MTHQEAGQAAEPAEAARLKKNHTLRTVQKLIVLIPHRNERMKRRNSSGKEEKAWPTTSVSDPDLGCCWIRTKLLMTKCFTNLQFKYFFIKNYHTCLLRPYKGGSSNMKFLIFFSFLGGQLQPAWIRKPNTEFKTGDPVESGSNPDSKHCPVSSGSTGSACFWASWNRIRNH
jgi:hypothetical protein